MIPTPAKRGVTKRAKYQTFDIVPIGLQKRNDDASGKWAIPAPEYSALRHRLQYAPPAAARRAPYATRCRISDRTSGRGWSVNELPRSSVKDGRDCPGRYCPSPNRITSDHMAHIHQPRLLKATFYRHNHHFYVNPAPYPPESVPAVFSGLGFHACERVGTHSFSVKFSSPNDFNCSRDFAGSYSVILASLS